MRDPHNLMVDIYSTSRTEIWYNPMPISIEQIVIAYTAGTVSMIMAPCRDLPIKHIFGPSYNISSSY